VPLTVFTINFSVFEEAPSPTLIVELNVAAPVVKFIPKPTVPPTHSLILNSLFVLTHIPASFVEKEGIPLIKILLKSLFNSNFFHFFIFFLLIL
jgi:hypothetical protein